MVEQLDLQSLPDHSAGHWLVGGAAQRTVVATAPAKLVARSALCGCWRRRLVIGAGRRRWAGTPTGLCHDVAGQCGGGARREHCARAAIPFILHVLPRAIWRRSRASAANDHRENVHDVARLDGHSGAY